MNRCEQCDQLATRSSITEGLAKYCHYLDGGAFERLRDVFTEDAAIELGQSYSGNLDGLVTWAAEQRRLGKRYSHHVTNVVLEVSDDVDAISSMSAVAALVVTGEAGAPARLVHGIYTDDWVRVADKWRLAKRLFRPRITTSISG